ncbi:MAG: FAD-dependent oxidoreductase [Candidatus Micrarchaeota archaeon]
MIYDVLIVGGGVTGFAAAMYSGRFNLKTLIVGEALGGTITMTDTVENYPGFKKLTGMELANAIMEHAKEYDIVVENDRVETAAKTSEGFEVTISSGKKFQGKTIIIATGTHWKKLNVPGEKEYANNGVHYCALCDGSFYKNKVIGVVGSGDSAVKEALVLANFGSKIYILARGDKIKAEPINQKRMENNKKIIPFTKVNVIEITGNGKNITGVNLDKKVEGKSELALDALFVEIGHLPLSELAVQLGVKVNGKGEIIINKMSETNVPGVYAAGDVVDTKFKQAITGVAEGVTAVYSANHFIGSVHVNKK